MFGEKRSWDYFKSHSTAIRALTSTKVTAVALQRHLIRRRFYSNGRSSHYTVVPLHRQPRSMAQRETQTERQQNLHFHFLQQNNFEWLGQAEADAFYDFNISVLREDIFIIFLSLCVKTSLFVINNEMTRVFHSESGSNGKHCWQEKSNEFWEHLFGLIIVTSSSD